MKKIMLFLAVLSVAFVLSGCQQNSEGNYSIYPVENISKIGTSPADFEKLLNISKTINSQPDDIKTEFSKKTSDWFKERANGLDSDSRNFTQFEDLYLAKQTALWNWTDSKTHELTEQLLRNRSTEWLDKRISNIDNSYSSLAIIEKVWEFQKTNTCQYYIAAGEKNWQDKRFMNKTREWVADKLQNIDLRNETAYDKLNNLTSALNSGFMKDLLSRDEWISLAIQGIREKIRSVKENRMYAKITNPKNNDSLTSTVHVNFTYNSTYKLDIARVYLGNELIDTDANYPYSWSFDPDEFLVGVYNLTINITDEKGNEGTDRIMVILPGKRCGNGFCRPEQGESCFICPKDCYCVNGVCDPGNPLADETGCVKPKNSTS